MKTIAEWVDEKPEDRRPRMKRVHDWLRTMGYTAQDLIALMDAKLPNARTPTRDIPIIWDLLDRSWSGTE